MDVIAINRYYGWYYNPGLPYSEPTMTDFSGELDQWYATHKKPMIITEYGAEGIAGLHKVMHHYGLWYTGNHVL